MSGRIVVVGSSNTDMILQMDRLPRPGETLLGGEFSMAAGGKGANQAVAARRAGGEVSFIARVGQDTFGKMAIDGFEREGIVVENVRVDDTCVSGTALIFVGSDGENMIGVASGANAQLSVADVEAASEQISQADVLLVQLETPLATVESALRVARQHGVCTILNPAPAQQLSTELLANVSILTPNEHEAEILTGIAVDDQRSAAEAAQKLRQLGIDTVIITMGSRGAYVATAENAGLVAGFPVEPVDTTAAGDTFNGALAVAVAEGVQLNDAVRFANAAGALSVTKLGAQPSTPKRSEVEAFLSRMLIN